MMAIHRRIIEKAGTFGSEFKKQTSTAVMAAFGLIIALSWKDVITDLVGKINPAQTNLWLSAVIVTIISIIGIAIISKWARSEEKK